MNLNLTLTSGASRNWLNAYSLNIYGDEYPLNKEEYGNCFDVKRLDCSKRKITLGGRGHGHSTNGTIKNWQLTKGRQFATLLETRKGTVDAVNATFLHAQSTGISHSTTYGQLGKTFLCFFQHALPKMRYPALTKTKLATVMSDKRNNPREKKACKLQYQLGRAWFWSDLDRLWRCKDSRCGANLKEKLSRNRQSAILAIHVGGNNLKNDSTNETHKLLLSLMGNWWAQLEHP